MAALWIIFRSLRNTSKSTDRDHRSASSHISAILTIEMPVCTDHTDLFWRENEVMPVKLSKNDKINIDDQ